jgi:hypothetical protein
MECLAQGGKLVGSQRVVDALAARVDGVDAGRSMTACFASGLAVTGPVDGAPHRADNVTPSRAENRALTAASVRDFSSSLARACNDGPPAPESRETTGVDRRSNDTTDVPAN